MITLALLLLFIILGFVFAGPLGSILSIVGFIVLVLIFRLIRGLFSASCGTAKFAFSTIKNKKMTLGDNCKKEGVLDEKNIDFLVKLS